MNKAFESVIFQKLVDALKAKDRVVDVSHQFFQLKENEERVRLAYQLLSEEKLLPTCPINKSKSTDTANNLRDSGNVAYVKKDYIKAMRLYNFSLAAATPHSKEYAMALANRSAVHFDLELYDFCLRDIMKCINSGYPRELRPKILERRLKCHIAKAGGSKQIRDSLDEAKKTLRKLATSLSSDKVEAYEASIKALEDKLKIQENNSHVVTAPMPMPRTLYGCNKVPEISYGCNREIECASDCVTLQYNNELGRYLIANVNIYPGDVIMVEQPYVSFLLPEAYGTHCYRCLQRCATPIPCLTCTEVLFCNEVCRTAAWDTYHRIDCPLQATLLENAEKMSLLALRVVLEASGQGSRLRALRGEVRDMEALAMSDPRSAGCNEEGRYLSMEYRAIHFLVDHTERRTVADLFRRSVTAACLLHCLETMTAFCDDFVGAQDYEELRVFAGGLLLRHLQSQPCNAHSVSELVARRPAGTDKMVYENIEIGAASYAALSLLNHSCDPNVVRHNYQNLAILRAVRTISAGEQILDNYGYHHAVDPKETRQKELLSQYYFQCECNACRNNWPVIDDQPGVRPHFRCETCRRPLPKNAVRGMVECTECGEQMDLDDLASALKTSDTEFRSHLDYVMSGRVLPNTHNVLISHLKFLEQNVVRPWRDFSDCQETLKQCLALHANHFVLFEKK